MSQSRGFLHITYLLYGHLDKLSGSKKSSCLNVYLSLMKYAWKKDNYSAGLRHATIEKDTGLSRNTVKRSLGSLSKLNIIKVKKGRSGCTYTVNQKFLKAEVSKFDTHLSKFDNKLSKLSYINRHNTNIHYPVKNIIEKGLDKEITLEELSYLPLPDLNKSIEINYCSYYCNLAKDIKKDREKEKNLVPPEKILQAVKNIAKQTNSRYKQAKAYNIRNGIKPWEKT